MKNLMSKNSLIIELGESVAKNKCSIKEIKKAANKVRKETIISFCLDIPRIKFSKKSSISEAENQINIFINKIIFRHFKPFDITNEEIQDKSLYESFYEYFSNIVNRSLSEFINEKYIQKIVSMLKFHNRPLYKSLTAKKGIYNKTTKIFKSLYSEDIAISSIESLLEIIAGCDEKLSVLECVEKCHAECVPIILTDGYKKGYTQYVLNMSGDPNTFQYFTGESTRNIIETIKNNKNSFIIVIDYYRKGLATSLKAMGAFVPVLSYSEIVDAAARIHYSTHYLTMFDGKYYNIDSQEFEEEDKTQKSNHDKSKKKQNNSKPTYDISILNTSESAENILKMIQKAQKNEEEKNGVKILFYGESGTGKTLFANHIAEKLGKKIIRKTPGDILGMYVGDSEKQIKAAFEEAEKTDSVLLFDEADTFFNDRKNAHTSWERSMVNEFLIQMENFKGILICTTNLKNTMDSAMKRRFHIMCEFKPLLENGIQTLLGKFFPKYKFSEDNVKRISSYSTATPGDFGKLSDKIRFMDKKDVSSEFIVSELCSIQEEKSGDSRKIGF